jgi:phosphoesterase RecJ-like protein
MDAQQEIIDQLIDYIDKAVLKNSVSNRQVAAVLDFLNEKLKIYPEYGAVLIFLTQEELNHFHYKKGDTEGFVNIPLSIKDVIFSAFMKEDTDKIKMSFRSRGLFPVNQFAATHFNGGGHLNASGGESYQSVEETINAFESFLPIYKNMLETEIERQRNGE